MGSLTYVLIFIFFNFVTYSKCVIVNEYGEYENIYVGISPDIHTSQLEYVLEELETLFQDSSKFLLSVTKGLFKFKEIIFVIPKTFKTSLSNRKWTTENSIQNPDIRILEKGLFQNNPYTIQHKGCGEKGLEINIPIEFFNYSKKDKSRIFIHEWMHYQYGIFDEHGFINDSLYPLYYSIPGTENDEFRVTGCTNEKPAYIFIDENNKPCSFHENLCFPFPSGELQNQNIRSSLMHKPLFPQTDHLCDDKYHVHVKNMPTKQNALCREKSAWNVLINNDDFIKKRYNRTADSLPTFKYVMQSEPHLIFAIEATSALQEDRIEHIRNAMVYFISYDLPKQSRVTMLNMKDLQFTKTFTVDENIVSEGIDKVLNVFPEAYGSADICIHCSITTALNVLKQDSETTEKYIILITTTDIVSTEVETVMNALKTENVKLFIIFFGKELTSLPLLDKLTAVTSGQLFVILEETNHHHFLSPLTIIYEAFRSIYEHFFWTFRNQVLIDQQIFYKVSSENSTSFYVDENIETLYVIITGPEFRSNPPIIKDTVKLKFDDKIYTFGQPEFSHKMKIPAYLFTIKNPEIGSWKLQFKRKLSQEKTFQVIIRAVTKDYRNIISSKSWISSKKINEKKPIAIYNKVYKGIHPVIDVLQFAFIINHSRHTQLILNLSDNGEGDPDITKNDGIYSRYISNVLEEGFYTLSIVTNKLFIKEKNKTQGDIYNCCGSAIPEILSANITTFSRVHTYGSFYVQNVNQEKDLRPRRIMDLHVVNVQAFNNSVKFYTLQWTAPGSYLDLGRVLKYEMKIFNSRTDALQNFETNELLTINEWNIHGKKPEPEVADSIQTAIVEFRGLKTGLYFLAMRALNIDENPSDVSNVIEIYFTKPIFQTLLPTYTTEMMSSTNPDGLITSNPNTESAIKPFDSKIGTTVGITCGILFLFIIIGIFLLIYLSNKRKRKQEKKKERISLPSFPRTEPHSNGITASNNGNPIYQSNSVTSIPHTQYAAPDNHFSFKSSTTNFNDDISISPHNNSNIYTINDCISDQNYFYDVPLRDNINIPFNPTCTSSLRKLRGDDNLSYRLGTDV